VPERCLFARLAAFAGPWTVEATEAVCAGDGLDREMVLEVLIRLVDKSLVVADESEDGTQRYRLLDTLRQYAREQLVTTGQADAVHGQHAAFYLELARRLERDLAGPRQTAWIHHVARDESNLRAALDWLEERGDVQQALEIASVLWRSWEVHGYLSAGRSRLAALLALPGAAEPTLARARVLDGAGVLALYQYDLRAARSYFKESLSLYLAHHERRGAAWVLVHLGWLCHDSGRYKAARYFLRRGLALAQAATDDAATARCLSLHPGEFDRGLRR
jgi:tetratricopeptide (TPR) repeat protein